MSKARLRILVADDDPILTAMAQDALAEDAGVVVAEDGLTAWDLLQVQPFDLMLCDLEMPRMDGFDVLRRVRADTKLGALPVIVLTGRQDVWAIDRAFEYGATSFITKPVVWPLLRHQVRFVLRCVRADRIIQVARSVVG
jgi:CheY-like chemotaxis protein